MIEAPGASSGRTARASEAYEYAETWTAVATSSHGASRNGSPRQLAGAKATEWTTPSRWSVCSRTRSASAARSSSLCTSSSITGGRSGSRLEMALTSDTRP